MGYNPIKIKIPAYYMFKSGYKSIIKIHNEAFITKLVQDVGLFLKRLCDFMWDGISTQQNFHHTKKLLEWSKLIMVTFY